MIPVTKPYIPNLEKYTKYISRVNDSAWLTNFGPLHQELTKRLEDWLGVQNLLLVSNGTLALQVAYRALGLKNKVLTTPFSFIASTSSLVWESLNPEFIDIKRNNLSIDVNLFPKSPDKDVTGILAVHVYGNPADTSEIEKYSTKHSLKTVYDGAHAFGIKKNDQSILNAGDATTLSLHATKVFHTVEGGAIIFKNHDDFIRAKQIINFGFDDNKDVRLLGTNVKLSEYQAAAGLVILDEIDKILEWRSLLHFNYQKELADLVSFPEWSSDTNQNGAYAPIILESEKQLLSTIDSMASAGVQTRRYFHPSLNTIKAITSKVVSCPVSEDISSRILCLPIFTSMTLDEQRIVIDKFKDSLK